MTEQQLQALKLATQSDQESSIVFSHNLLRDWVRRNTIEGTTIEQSLWMFSRFEEFSIEIGKASREIDIFKMFQSGALPTLYYCLLRIKPDDMTENFYWVTQDRIDWVKARIEEFIGPEAAKYI